MTLSPFEDPDSAAFSLLSAPSEWAEERGKSHDSQLQLSRTSRHRAITTLPSHPNLASCFQPPKCSALRLAWPVSCSARTVSPTTSVCSRTTTASVNGGRPPVAVTSCTPTSSPSTASVLPPPTPCAAWSSARRPGSVTNKLHQPSFRFGCL